MTTEPSKVIATVGATPDSVRVHHRDFPDLRADGESIEDAAANLVQDLTRALADAADDLHRDALRQAVGEVRDFIGRRGP